MKHDSSLPTQLTNKLKKNKLCIFLFHGVIKKNMVVQATRQSLWPFMSFWFGLGMILILNFGGKRVISGDLSLGTITQFIQYLLYMDHMY